VKTVVDLVLVAQPPGIDWVREEPVEVAA